MLRRVTIIDSGATEFLPGSLVERSEFESANRRVVAEGAASPGRVVRCSAAVGGVVPGDHSGADRRGDQLPLGQAADRSRGERDHRQADPGRHRHQPVPEHPGAADRGGAPRRTPCRPTTTSTARKASARALVLRLRWTTTDAVPTTAGRVRRIGPRSARDRGPFASSGVSVRSGEHSGGCAARCAGDCIHGTVGVVGDVQRSGGVGVDEQESVGSVRPGGRAVGVGDEGPEDGV